MSDAQEFPGWPSTRGRSVSVIYVPIQKIAEVTDQTVMYERETPYIWLNSERIGAFTVLGGPGSLKDVSEVFVDSLVEKDRAFDAVKSEILSKLGEGFDFHLEDQA